MPHCWLCCRCQLLTAPFAQYFPLHFLQPTANPPPPFSHFPTIFFFFRPRRSKVCNTKCMPAALDFLVACIALSVYSFSASVCMCDVRVCGCLHVSTLAGNLRWPRVCACCLCTVGIYGKQNILCGHRLFVDSGAAAAAAESFMWAQCPMATRCCSLHFSTNPTTSPIWPPLRGIERAYYGWWRSTQWCWKTNSKAGQDVYEEINKNPSDE